MGDTSFEAFMAVVSSQGRLGCDAM